MCRRATWFAKRSERNSPGWGSPTSTLNQRNMGASHDSRRKGSPAYDHSKATGCPSDLERYEPTAMNVLVEHRTQREFLIENIPQCADCGFRCNVCQTNGYCCLRIINGAP